MSWCQKVWVPEYLVVIMSGCQKGGCQSVLVSKCPAPKCRRIPPSPEHPSNPSLTAPSPFLLFPVPQALLDSLSSPGCSPEEGCDEVQRESGEERGRGQQQGRGGMGPPPLGNLISKVPSHSNPAEPLCPQPPTLSWRKISLRKPFQL